MSALKVRFGHRLKHLRMQRSLTQEQFAELTKLSTDFISLIERGKRAPSFQTLEIFADVLKVSVAQLFEEMNNPHS